MYSLSQNQYIRIGDAATFLGVSIDTLRRWDKDGKLKPIETTRSHHRYYSRDDLSKYLDRMNIEKIAYKWVKSNKPLTPPKPFYCQTISDFSARLPRLEDILQKENDLNETYSLITSSASEIGNNSFDHNLGNWPNIPGIFFGYSIKSSKRIVVLADKGQGILTTLKRVKKNLLDDKEALNLAFTEIMSGRSPESRGNGLKYVRKVITSQKFFLKFQTGNAVLKLKHNDTKLDISISKYSIPGCLAIIEF